MIELGIFSHVKFSAEGKRWTNLLMTEMLETQQKTKAREYYTPWHCIFSQTWHLHFAHFVDVCSGVTPR